MLLHASVCAGGRPLIEQDSIIRLIRELRFRSQGFTRVSTADCLHTRNLHDGRSLSCSYLMVSWRHLPTDTRFLPISYFPDCPVALPVQQQSLRIRQRSVEDRPSSNGVSHVALLLGTTGTNRQDHHPQRGYNGNRVKRGRPAQGCTEEYFWNTCLLLSVVQQISNTKRRLPHPSARPCSHSHTESVGRSPARPRVWNILPAILPLFVCSFLAYLGLKTHCDFGDHWCGGC